MLDWITESQTVWDRMKECGKPVLLYGMGNGAVKIMKRMQDRNIPVSGIFASDEFVRGHSFCGFPVRRISEMEAEWGDFLAVLSFAARDTETMELIRQVEKRHELVAPDVPVAGDILFTLDFVREHAGQFDQVYSMLADSQSRRVYASVINYKISGKLSYLSGCETSAEESYREILKPGQDETFADLGAYRGDTIEEFLRYTGGRCRKVIAFEPDGKNFQKLIATMERLGLDSTDCLNAAAYSHETELLFDSRAGRQSALLEGEHLKGMAPVKAKKVKADSLDHHTNGEPVTFLNMDVEGCEKAALEGCRETIQSSKPKMLIAAYHRSEDLFALPLQVAAYRPDYQFYFRHLPYYPAWDTNLLCV